MKKYILFLALAVLALSSCRDDVDDFTSDLVQDEPAVFVESSIRGRVIDALGEPVANAIVNVNGETIISQSDGTFKFTSISSKKGGDVVTATTSEHFKGISHVNFAPDGSAYVEINMMEKGIPELIDPTMEQSVAQNNGLKLSIPANSVVSANGQAYTGKVNVFAAWIDPTDENVGGLMPGALTAQDANGEDKVLATYGMVALELETESGEILNLKTGAEVTTEVPIPAELLGDAPEEMPMWIYDVETAQWLENGVCVKDGGYYVAVVSQTGYWNCDVPLESICLSAQLLNADSTFASYVKVIVEDLTDNFIYWGFTDSTGYFCGSVPRAALLKISYVDHCDNILYTEEVGPFSGDEMLGALYIDEIVDEFFINVIGSISHCQTNDVPQGHLGVRLPGKLKIYPFESAAYNIDIGLKCVDFPELELIVYSSSQEQSTIPTIINTETDVDLSSQFTCEDLTDWFRLDIDGVQYFTSPTQYYLKLNQTTDWMILEGLSGIGTFTIELRDYQGIGEYTDNVFFKTEHGELIPNFNILDGASPDVVVNIADDDGEFITGNYSGTATDNLNETRNISGDFVIKKAP